jgi:sulfoxide reductase heme-binding subunit YedZ
VSPGTNPTHVIWWLVSRAAGVIALLLVSLSVLIGLAMANKLFRRPGLKRSVARAHEHIALTALAALGVHGLALLGDTWLKPGWRGIALPFAMSYRPLFTGVGIIGGYLVLLLGPSFYLRRRIGARRWRKVHTTIAVAWLLSAVHTLGAGSDATKLWLQAIVIAPGIPIVYLVVLRALSPGSRRATRPALAARAAPEMKPHGDHVPVSTPSDRALGRA